MNKRDPLTSKRALMARIQTEGIEAAFEALMDVCKDKKAPAPARATAGTSIFRAGGLMSNKPEVLDKPPEEMSAAEIVARINELQAKREAVLSGWYNKAATTIRMRTTTTNVAAKEKATMIRRQMIYLGKAQTRRSGAR